jgi:hypothetical protein
VRSTNTDFAYGIEDQEGLKGKGVYFSGASLGSFDDSTIQFYQSSNTYMLRRLEVELSDVHPNAMIDIESEPNKLRGYNVMLAQEPPPQPDYSQRYVWALQGYLTLLSGYSAIIVEGIFVTLSYVEWLAYNQYSNVEWMELYDCDWNNPSYIKVPTEGDVVDATLCFPAYWVLNTPGYVTHSLTITAKATYETYTTDGVYLGESSITTSVTLTLHPDNNNNPNNAEQISQYSSSETLLVATMRLTGSNFT